SARKASWSSPATSSRGRTTPCNTPTAWRSISTSAATAFCGPCRRAPCASSRATAARAPRDAPSTTTSSSAWCCSATRGSGKTTSFYMIVGLLPTEGGRIFLEGQEITALPMYQRCRMGVGYLPQESSVFRKLTVEENLLAILETLEVPVTDRRARARELLAELDLTTLAPYPAFTLSGGER